MPPTKTPSQEEAIELTRGRYAETVAKAIAAYITPFLAGSAAKTEQYLREAAGLDLLGAFGGAVAAVMPIDMLEWAIAGKSSR